MSQLRICDGCGKPLKTMPTIIGHRANGLTGGRPLPDGDFDWCESCALIAFNAVRDEHAARSNPRGVAVYG